MINNVAMFIDSPKVAKNLNFSQIRYQFKFVNKKYIRKIPI